MVHLGSPETRPLSLMNSTFTDLCPLVHEYFNGLLPLHLRPLRLYTVERLTHT